MYGVAGILSAIPIMFFPRILAYGRQMQDKDDKPIQELEVTFWERVKGIFDFNILYLVI
jgi:hypothetical protein